VKEEEEEEDVDDEVATLFLKQRLLSRSDDPEDIGGIQHHVHVVVERP
jgi:hypothetical protein